MAAGWIDEGSWQAKSLKLLGKQPLRKVRKIFHSPMKGVPSKHVSAIHLHNSSDGESGDTDS